MSRLFNLILVASSLAFGAPTHVAVNDLKARGVSTTDAEILGDRLRAELIGTGAFRVMERGQMDQILKEQSFQASGGCDQSECAVEMGRLLAVDRMIVGSVGKIGDLYTVQARILDVQTGEIVTSVNQDYEGRIEGLLSKSIPVLARRLAIAVGPSTMAQAANPTQASATSGREQSISEPRETTSKPTVHVDPIGTSSKAKTWIRWTSASGAVGAGIVALLWRRESSSQKAKAEKAVVDYKAATTGFEDYKAANAQAVSKANSATTKALVWAGISGLFATTFAVTFAF